MGIFLKVLGALFLLIVVVVGFVIWRVRRFLKKVAKDLVGACGNTPSRITLSKPDDDEWLESEELQDAKAQLIELGFQEAGAFQIDEMFGFNLLGFVHPELQLMGVVYATDYDDSVWVDICSETKNESLTVSSAPSGESADLRPGKRAIFMAGASAEDLFAVMEQERGEGPFDAVPLEQFAKLFQDSYAADMDWRNSRGGAPSREEFDRETRKSDQEMSEEQLEEAYHNVVYTMGVLRLSTECLDWFQKETEMSVQQWEDVRDRCFALHEHVPNSHLPDFIRDHFGGLEDEHLSRLEKLLDVNQTAAENFRAFNESLPEELRAERVGAVGTPVSAEIFAAPDCLEGG